jgi:predicted nucleotidyltransferase
MDISRLFKSKTRKAIFGLYFTNPEAEYYLRELERVLNIPVSMIHKELLRLEKEGIFAAHKKGNLVYYHINKAYPLFAEFKSIVFKTIGIQGLLKEAAGKIKGVEAAFIYGSFARNSENATSDIDLLVIGNINEDELVREINCIEKSIKREINYTLYTMAEFKKKKRLKDSFISDLLESPKVFLIGDKDDL